MNNNKLMLIFGFDSNEREKLKKQILISKMPGYKVVSDEMTKMKIGDILNGLKFEIYSQSLPKEKVVLFNNFNDSEVNSAIKCLKAIDSKIIMAVVTPTSIEWTFDYLLEHLIEEREWYRKKNTQE